MDPKSPVYQDVMNAERHPGPYPQFSQIPPTPTDIRPVSAWATAIANIKTDRARLDSTVAALPPVPTDTEAFAANARTQAQAPAAAPTAATAADTQDFAQSLRARATPPPKRRAHKR